MTMLIHMCPDEDPANQKEWVTLCGRTVTLDNNVYAYYMKDYVNRCSNPTPLSEHVLWCKNCMRTKDFGLHLLGAL